MARKYATIVCAPGSCPTDPDYEHDNYYGCVPRDFSPVTGRSRRHRQTRHGDRYYWDGGCDQARLAADRARP